MGISSSKENLDLRSDQFPWDTLEDAASMPEKKRVELQPKVEATVERVMRDLHALFPPKVLGESSSLDQPATERDEEVTTRLCEFMKGGACKESFTCLLDCINENDGSPVCRKYIPKLIKCMDAHSDYYQPIISLAESTLEQIGKEELAEEHAKRNHAISRIFR